ncbi:MAG: RND family efflux transporter MFP subunit [Sulfitobacter sp.]|jgi:RND family efflux transporter MFP subunit
MKALRQIFVSIVVLAGGLYLWAFYVPAARPLLESTGIFDYFGVALPETVAAAPQASRRSGGATQVIAAIVTEQAISDRITAIGDGRARHSVTVRSNAVGVITDLTLAVGSRVEAGSIIAKLEDEAEQIGLEQARIDLEDARTEEQRIKRLQTTGAVTEVRLRETEVALRSAELAVRQAEFDLSQRLVVAPISGWVGIIDIEQGDRVNSQDVLATITDRSAILIDFRVPERVVGKIRQGQSIEVTPLGQRGLALQGEISTIDTVVDRASRTLLVRGQVNNSEDLLRAGMAFSVKLTFPGETLLSIPPLAVQWSSDGPFVWAIREGKAAQLTVSIEQRNSDSVLITSDDLKAGETVITEGMQTLREGSDVTAVGPEEAMNIGVTSARGAVL